MNTDPEKQLLDALDEQAANLDGATLSRLRQARAQALEQPRRWWRPVALHWLPAGGLATTAALVLGVSVWLGTADQELLPINGISSLEIVTLEEDMELLEQLDFYDWLEQAASGDHQA